ncbi:MAG: hypothetical protein AB1716_10610 [Planctomycetota bacterium]
MAKKGGISPIEQHLEKGLLGAAVLFMVVMGAYVFVHEPNKVVVDGKPVGPAELDEEIRRKALDLKGALERAAAPEPNVPDYAQQLEQQFSEPLFAVAERAGTPLRPAPRVAGVYNPPIPISAEELKSEPVNVPVVTPLPPTALVTQTGMSLVRREPQVAFQETAATSDEEAPATETPWVTIAGWFSEEAQQREMTRANYAPYRAKVIPVEVEAQRQALLPNGEWSSWEDVRPGKWRPRLTLPEPMYDSRGELQNSADIDQALERVRALRGMLIQTPFYAIEGGAYWEIPVLPGLEEPEEEDEDELEEPRKPREPRTPRQPTYTPPAGGRGGPPMPMGGRGGPPMGGGRGAPMGGGRGGPPIGGRGGPPSAAPTRAPQGSNPRQLAQQQIRDARKALARKQFNEAMSLASGVVSNTELPRSIRSIARDIVREAEKRLRQNDPQLAVTPDQLGNVRHPDRSGDVAVWFHDDSVEPGKTYRYRLRVKLWNRYVGRRNLVREEDKAKADQVLLDGDWSTATSPVTVAPKRHFFVKAAAINEPAAQVDVFAWHKGNWVRDTFKVRVGDVIGGPSEVRVPDPDAELDDTERTKKEIVDFATGAIVLEVREQPVMVRRSAGREGEFAYREAKSLVVVYLDPADGQVKERVADIDRNNPEYARLREEVESQS